MTSSAIKKINRERSRRRTAPLHWVKFSLYAWIILLLWWLCHRSPTVSYSTSPSFTAFQRSPDVIDLEEFIKSDPHIGICQNQVSLLPEIHPITCRPITCLYSHRLRKNIDLSVIPLAIIPDGVLNEPCIEPRGGQLGIPPHTSSKKPQVSFIITVYNGVKFTMQCILELFRTAGEAESAEFIVVNDGSTESVAPLEWLLETLHQYFGIQYTILHNPSPTGFGAANNKGVGAAQGEFIAFINNDMMVVKGWLATLLWTFKHRPHAGLVGPMFIGRGNYVQEAGGLVWDTGRAMNVGRGVGINPFFNHLRQVDYISAACVMMRKNIFTALGMFDESYEKGFYEDTDLAMTVALAGMEVLMQPLAVVFHQEGSTFGTEETSQLKRELMDKNHKVFANKWHEVLQESHCPVTEGVIVATRRHSYPNVLWIDDIVPEPDRDSGSLRMIGIMKALLMDGYALSFLPTVTREPQYEVVLRAMGVLILPVVPVNQWMFQEQGKCIYDVIYIARRAIFSMGIKQVLQQCPGVPIIYDVVDLHFLREARQAMSDTSTNAAESWEFKGESAESIISWLSDDNQASTFVRENRDTELSFIETANLTIILSDIEEQIVRHYRPDAKLGLLPNIYDVPDVFSSGGAAASAVRTSIEHCERRSGFLFVGNMNHAPNRQAIITLIRDILPAVVAQLPPDQRQQNAVLHIVGSNVVPDWLQALMQQDKHVVFHGYLSDADLNFLYSEVKASVAPLLSGAGVKGKVAQALLLGVPVVATPLAVEGMYIEHGVNGLIGDTPEEFAKQLVRVLSDCELWSRLVQQGHTMLKEKFSFEKAHPIVRDVFKQVGHGPVKSPKLRAVCRSKKLGAITAATAV